MRPSIGKLSAVRPPRGIQPATSRRNWRARVSGLLGLVFLLVGLQAGAADPSADFDQANKLYEQGKFAEAASAFEKLAHGGRVSEPLYFNWGNALFKSGHLGQAIAAYQQAERLSPRDPDVRANLQFARNQVQGPTLRPDRVARGLGALNLNEWTCLAATAAWLWLLALTMLQWRPILKAALRSYVLWLGLLTAFLCGCFVIAFYFDHVAQRAIVITAETEARQAPLDESQNAFTLHDGAELQILDRKDQWLQVQVDSRRIGWIRQDSVLVRPSI